MNEYLQFLKNHTLFAGFTHEQITTISSLSKISIYEPQDIIINEGDIANDIFIIINGEVEVLKLESRDQDQDQNQLQLAILKSSDVIGEIGLLEDMPRTATIRATEPTQILGLSIEKLRDLAKNESFETKLIYYKLVEAIAHQLCSRLRHANEIMSNFLHTEKTSGDLAAAQNNVFAGLFSF